MTYQWGPMLLTTMQTKRTHLEEDGIRILLTKLIKLGSDDLAGSTPSSGVINDYQRRPCIFDGAIERILAVDANSFHRKSVCASAGASVDRRRGPQEGSRKCGYRRGRNGNDQETENAHRHACFWKLKGTVDVNKLKVISIILTANKSFLTSLLATESVS